MATERNENVHSPITTQEIRCAIENFSTREVTISEGSMLYFYMTFKEQRTPVLYRLFQRTEGWQGRNTIETPYPRCQ